MNFAVHYRAIVDCANALKTVLREKADIDATVFHAMTPVTEKEELLYKSRGSQRDSASATMVTGEAAFEMALNAFSTFNVEPGLSRVFFPAFPGVISVADIEYVIPYVIQLNKAKKDFESLITQLPNQDKRYDAVHDIDVSLVTKMLYRKVNWYPASATSVHFNYVTKSTSKNYVLSELIDKKLQYKGQQPKGRTPEQWQWYLSSVKDEALQYSRHLFRVWRKCSVSVEMAVKANGKRNWVRAAGLPLIIPSVNRIGELGNYDLNVKKCSNRAQKTKYEWTMLASELNLHRTVTPLSPQELKLYERELGSIAT